MTRIASLGLRALTVAGLGLALLAPTRSTAVPNYYSYAEFYSDATYSQMVGGWKSCPPDQGGYTHWGQWTPYEKYYASGARCGLVEM